MPTLGFPLPFLVAAAFAVGASVGSFLNVVIARVPFGDSIVWPGSHCTSCGSPIRAHHNIPILSWFWLRGRCKSCLAPFSIRYAVIELAFALVCAFAVARHGLSLPAVREVTMMGLLIPLSAMDLDWWILPHELTWPGIALGLLLSSFEGLGPLELHLLAAAVGGLGLVVVGFVAERVFKREALGRGDVWLIALIGAFLGPRALLPVLLLSSLQGVLVGIPLLMVRRRKEKAAAVQAPAPVQEPQAEPEVEEKKEERAKGEDEDWKPDPTAVPFGPFLSLAAAEVLYFSRLPQVLFPWPF
jgi:leader peptidase (prepilin peptidase)/N-methyltransferase